jgi:tRNA G46 methylase TrmB
MVGLFTLGWRWASRKWSLPCPSLLAWSLDNSLVQRSPITLKTLDRIGLHPGEKVLEIGPGPGRLLIPAAKQFLPDGEVIGIDIQPKIIERLQDRRHRDRVEQPDHRANHDHRPERARDRANPGTLR